MNPNVIY